MKTNRNFLCSLFLLFSLAIVAQEPEQCPCPPSFAADQEVVTDNPFNSYVKKYSQSGRLTRTNYLTASANIFGVELYECFYTFDWVENVPKQPDGFASSTDTLDLGMSIRYGWEAKTEDEDCGSTSFFFLIREPGFWGNYPYDFNRGEWAGFADDNYLATAIFRGIETRYFNEGTLQSVAQSGIEIIQPLAKFKDCGLRPPSMAVFDANPEFIETGLFSGDVTNVLAIGDVTKLFDAVKKPRSAVCADGVTEILLRFRFNEIVNARLDLPSEFGSVEYPWASQSHEIDGSHYVFALYRPPIQLPQQGENIQLGNVAGKKISFTLRATSDEGSKEFEFDLNLIRPPVVLVHGTFDDPDNCWRTPIPKPGFKSMVQRLEDEGFKVFTVDYRNTNGRYEFDRGPGFLTDDFRSGFEKNKRVVFENPGGIGDALDYYRGPLNSAVTQVDAIGHSLGGVLIRVYASDQDNGTSYDTDYFRDDNFQEGDINRIITLSSTHHGSDMSSFHDFLERNQTNTSTPFLEQFFNTATTLLTYFAGIGTAQIVADQRPASSALKRIGPTPIPAHSIVCTVRDMKNITENIAEENSAQGYNLFWKFLTTMLYFNPNTMEHYVLNLMEAHHRQPSDLVNTKKDPKFNSVHSSIMREARKPSMRQDFLDKFSFNLSRLWFIWHLFNEEVDDTWIETNTVYVTQYETTEINYGDFNDNLQVEIQEEQWDLIRDEMLETFEVEHDESFTNEVIDFFRYLIFKNADNDCTVRYESQTGSLKEPYISDAFDKHLHSFVPRYTDVQDRVIELLKSGIQFFDPEGYPEAGRLMPVELPDPEELNQRTSFMFTDNPEKTGCEAICWSGYVPSHARAYAQVADEQDLVILARPVNPDATAVIAADNATKPMNLKGKSSNWGPMRALIAEDQRFSKLWFQYEVTKKEKRDSEIKKYNGEVVKSLNDPADIAVLRHLEKKYVCNGVEQNYAVYFDTTMEDAVKSIVLTADNKTFYRWVKELDDPCDDKDQCCPLELTSPVPNVHLKALNVLANPQEVINSQPLFYTADYDLLAIGFHEKRLDGNENDPYNQDKELIPDFTPEDFDSERGFITERQKDLVADLNEAVKTIGNYKGGNVTHHGPENQYYIAGNPNKGSPYVDYPIIAFEPDDSRSSKKGRIRAIPKGKPGFRDIYLKQYMARMRRKGYNLYPNQVAVGWKWDHYHTYSFHKPWDDRDAPKLDAGPEEIPFPKNCTCDNTVVQLANTEDPRQNLSNPEISEKVFPNPALSILNVEFYNPTNQDLNIIISDVTGTTMRIEHFNLPKGILRKTINLSDLPAGFYVLTMHFGNGQTITKKFIKAKSN